MLLTHKCPNCKKLHELNCTPEPSKLCYECDNLINGLVTNKCICSVKGKTASVKGYNSWWEIKNNVLYVNQEYAIQINYCLECGKNLVKNNE